jgi:DNA repair protein RadC
MLSSYCQESNKGLEACEGAFHLAEEEAAKTAGPAVAEFLSVIREVATRQAGKGVIKSPWMTTKDKVVEYLHLKLAPCTIEEFHVIFLDSQHRLIAIEQTSRGTINRTSVYPREIIKRALQLDSAAIILVHNHPSGNPQPSPEDVALTRSIAEASNPMDIRVLDHLVIAREGYVSLRERGLI